MPGKVTTSFLSKQKVEVAGEISVLEAERTLDEMVHSSLAADTTPGDRGPREHLLGGNSLADTKHKLF